MESHKPLRTPTYALLCDKARASIEEMSSTYFKTGSNTASMCASGLASLNAKRNDGPLAATSNCSSYPATALSARRDFNHYCKLLVATLTSTHFEALTQLWTSFPAYAQGRASSEGKPCGCRSNVANRFKSCVVFVTVRFATFAADVVAFPNVVKARFASFAMLMKLSIFVLLL